MIKKIALLSFFSVSFLNGTEKPNILFLITDDQFKRDMNFFPEGKGKNLTPHIDELVSGSTIMRRQYVTSPVCTPSRYSCLTGVYPSRSKSQDFLSTMRNNNGQSVVQWNTFITDEAYTLPRKLKAGGYFTGLVGKNHVYTCKGRKKPLWDANPQDPKVIELLQKNQQIEIERAKEIGFDYAASLYYNNPVENGVKALASHNLAWVAEGAHQFFEESAKNDKPFFLYLATTVPHGPSEASRSWAADRRITATGLRDKPIDLLPDADSIRERIKEAGLNGKRRENILYLDDFVGSIISKLKDTKQLNNTIIVYFNDHGQKSKGTVYDGGVHSESFLWKKEGFPVGADCLTPVSNVDLAPTLLDLAGLKYDASEYDGESFAKALNGKESSADRALYFELGYVRGIRKGNWKYIALRYPKNATEMPLNKRKTILDKFNEDQKRKGRPVYTKDPLSRFSHVSLIPGGGDAEHMSMGKYPAFYDADQLYNLAEDPNEQKNLAADPTHEKVLVELKEELKAQLSKLPGSFGEFKTVTEN